MVDPSIIRSFLMFLLVFSLLCLLYFAATQEPEATENDEESLEGQDEDECVQAMMAEMCTLEETDEPEDLRDQVVFVVKVFLQVIVPPS